MIDTFEIFEELIGSVNTQQGGHVRPNRNFIQWLNAASLGLFEEKFTGWEKSQKITDDLSRPFLKSINVVVVKNSSNDGVAAFPDDYAHFSSARYFSSPTTDAVMLNPEFPIYDSCGKLIEKETERPPGLSDATWAAIQSQLEAEEEKEEAPASKTLALRETQLEKVDNSRWAGLLEHRFNRPTLDDPKMTQFDKGFRVAPAGVTSIVLDYLRMPSPATFEYTVAPGDVLTGKGDYLIYDKLKSKPLEWSPLIKNELLIRLDKKYGKYIREDFIWQVSESDRKQTT